MRGIHLKCPQELLWMQQGVNALQEQYPALEEGELWAEYRPRKGLKLRVSPQRSELYFSCPREFFRGLGLWGSAAAGCCDTIEEAAVFETLGVMYDCSRNAVPTVEKIKQMLGQWALMGYDTLLLYMEDVYTLEKHPEFGHYRGRYSRNELREIDDYAQNFGIEVIPCIQALAHMERFLRWKSAEKYKDTESVLLCGEEQVYELIEEMLVEMKHCFRSQRIHLGLDEAWGLGMGNYFAKHGFVEEPVLVRVHLEKLSELCRKHAYSPMMWGDMPFSIYSPHKRYYAPDIQIPPQAASLIPRDFTVVYWDYYHQSTAFYERYIRQYREMGVTPAFAGGVCSWCGPLPNLLRTFRASSAALEACEKQGVREVFCCVWKDDGSELYPDAEVPGILLYSSLLWKDKDWKSADRLSRLMSGLPFEQYRVLGNVDELRPGMSETGEQQTPNPHKYFLWQDIFLGQFDREAQTGDWTLHYKKMARLFENASGEANGQAAMLFELAQCLCEVLSEKVDLGIQLKEAYEKDDRESMRRIQERMEKQYLPGLLTLHTKHREAWLKCFKPFGWEFMDMKYGFLRTRAEYAVQRLRAYLAGTCPVLEELGEPRISSDGEAFKMSGQLPYVNSFLDIATVAQYKM